MSLERKKKINEQGLNTQEIIIDDDVWLGKGVTVLPGVKIGKGSVIGANSLVNKNIPSYKLAAGNPIKCAIKYFGNDLK